MVLFAVNLLFGRKETWEEVKKFLSDMDFIKKLQGLDPMSVKSSVWAKLRSNYLSRPEFNPTMLKEKVSEAISTLANFCINMEIYYLKKKEVDPKEQNLAAAEKKLAAVEEEMNSKFSELSAIKENVSELNERLEASVGKARALEEEQARAKLHLFRAEKLIKGLDEESLRWSELVARLGEDAVNVTGNMVLASSALAFLGPLTFDFRARLLKDWAKFVHEDDIAVSEHFALAEALSDPVSIKDWQIRGLPADEVSTDNAVIMANSLKPPLLIDPQMQITKWLKNAGSGIEVVCLKYKSQGLLKVIENAIRFGNAVLVEDVEESVDPSLDSALLRQTFRRGGQLFIKFNDQEIPFNPDFKLFLATKLQNPHFLPETTIKVSLINCTVTEFGLQEQLLVEIVLNECPQLEEQREALIRQIAEDKRQLSEIQARILKLINEAEGNLLDNEELITTLDASKLTSDTIGRRMKESEATSVHIAQAREVYRPLAIQGATLYFVLAALSNVSHMYQFSLEYFVRLFTQKMREHIEDHNDPGRRVQTLSPLLQRLVFQDVCRGLYQRHKLLFAFMIAVKLQMSKGVITERQWEFFCQGSTGQTASEQIMRHYPEYLPQKTLSILDQLINITPSFAELAIKLVSFRGNFLDLLNKPELQIADLSFLTCHFEPTNFERLLLLKSLREEKLSELVFSFVRNSLGPEFVDFPALELKSAVLAAGADTPVVFVLSPGADPLTSLQALAQELEMELRFRTVSLGQGQGDRAKELIKASRLNGEWVLLQNCHLAVSWLPQLENLVESPSEEAHPDFRLFLTTMPDSAFPPAILQRAVKLTVEPPKGIRANLRQIYLGFDERKYNECPRPDVYKPLLFCLSVFHAIVLERRNFGAIGWNTPYEWMASDFETSQKHAKNYLEKYDRVPFEILRTLIGVVNYGGRVTDYNDERTITALLKSCLNERALTAGYSLDGREDSAYFVPRTDDLETVLGYISSLPLQDKPEIFGLNQNATINLEQNLAKEFRANLLRMESVAQKKGDSDKSEELLVRAIDRMLERLPNLLPFSRSQDSSAPLIVFRNQEAERFGVLLGKMKSSLKDLRDSVQGLIPMSLELEDMGACFQSQRLPENWARLSYLSLKSLAAWFEDFLQRVQFFNLWITQTALSCYWISSFYFPQGFLTALLQTHSRENKIEIDTLVFNCAVQKEGFAAQDQVKIVPPHGANVHGFFLENAFWDGTKGYLLDSPPKLLLQEMPIVWFEPALKSQTRSSCDGFFECPVYKTSERRGELSTTGHSTNFICYIRLPIKNTTDDHWIKRGTALLLQKDD